MSELGDLRTQVDQLKQRLYGSHGRQRGEATQVQDQLAEITAKVRRKQDEVSTLQRDGRRLKDELDRLQGEVAGKQGEIDALSAENQQLRTMLEEVLSAADDEEAPGPEEALSDFCREMSALVDEEAPEAAPETASDAATDDAAADDVIFVPASPDQLAETEEAAPAASEEASTDSAAAQPAPAEEVSEEAADSPVLKRILRRGRARK